MTKTQYFEMMEMLQQEPIEEDIPVELSDLPYEAQEAYSIYLSLNDNWDSMSGTYLGKFLQGISEVMDLLGVDNKKVCLEIVLLFDNYRKEEFAKQLEK
jgi:hypothetical protein